MEIISYCDACFKGTSFDAAAAPAEIVCRKCRSRRAVTITDSIRSRNLVDRCVLCGCGHLYLEKDFNGYVGFGIIVAAIVGSAVLWARNVYLSVAVLGAAALVDLVFWVISGERTVCYRCVATYRKTAPNAAHERYELGMAGRFADDYDEQRQLHQK
ncbi:MAG TPA: hypothetical protein VKW04_03050 [Planctomycetota bacterium]|nr:hypothetical protein [Planctomycetota bacterium]